MNARITLLVLLLAGSVVMGQPAASQPATAPPAGKDLCKGAVDPYDSGDERTRFFAAAGPDSELDEKEFTANQSAPNAFVREFDNWNAVSAFDKNGNGTIDWFEADTYRQALREKVLAAFDQNKDGRLTGAERDQANAALAEGKIRLGREPGGGLWAGRGQDLLKTYDVDGDGQLNDQERQAMREGIRRQGQDMLRQWQLRRWDANGDGQLDEQETAAMEAEQARWRAAAEEARKAFLKPYDKDGDGQLNEEEQAAMRESLRAEVRSYRDEWVRRWDANGDGQLDEQERTAMREKLREEGDRRRREMDLNGDGQVSPEEATAYFQALVKKYDADGDGVLNEQERRTMWQGETRALMGGASATQPATP